MQKSLSIIIPAYNEEKIIEQIVQDLKNELNRLDLNYEIVVVNDGSTDKTKEILEKIPGIKIINHPYNKGNGAALKTGIKNARYNYILFFDADGQHKPEYIKKFLEYSDQYDMIAGARIGYKGPFIRQPGKKLLHWLANYLSKQKIPDLNCGMRLFRKKILLRYLHLLPDSFSLYTTTSLLFSKEGLNVKYIPIKINKRIGKSTIKPQDALDSFILILRVILLSSPLRVFLPVTALLSILGVASLTRDVIRSYHSIINIGDITVFLFIASLLIFFFGLLADQIAAIRRELK